MAKKYEVKIIEKVGSCDDALFEKMAKNGDLNAVRVKELIDTEVTINGYAKCEITTEEKTFTIYYYDSAEYGIFSTGSEIFADSVNTYYEDTKTFFIKEVKTKKGKTYKVQPVLRKQEEIIK